MKEHQISGNTLMLSLPNLATAQKKLRICVKKAQSRNSNSWFPVSKVANRTACGYVNVTSLDLRMEVELFA
jgi:hypothetical protein